MSQPTTAILLSGSFPPPDPGNQLCQPKTNGGQPFQYTSVQPQPATASLLGVVKPDGTTTTIDADGTIHAVGGTGSGGTSASGGSYICVVPSGPKDTSNTQYIIPAPVLAGTGYFYVRNGVMQRQLGTKAEFAVQGSTITTTTPLASDDWHEFYYVMGTPNSESGGGGGVTPTGDVILRGSNIASSNSAGSITVTLPAGSAAGDLAVCFAGTAWPCTVPGGWTVLQSDNHLAWMAEVFYKILTSGDIATGHVTCTMTNAFDCVLGIVTFVGSTGGVRENEYGINGGGAGGATITNVTSGAVLNTDAIIYFATMRYTTPALVTITPSSGSPTNLQTAFTTNSASLLADQAAPGGVLSVANFLSASTAFWAAQVVVMAP